jgi:hypothetical protein
LTALVTVDGGAAMIALMAAPAELAPFDRFVNGD